MTIDFINKNTFALRLMSIIIMFSIQSYSQSLRLYVIPPPHELNWKNPHTLLRSLTINYLKKNHYPHQIRAMGHIMVQLAYMGDTLNNRYGFR
jgi:hypothetical protein